MRVPILTIIVTIGTICLFLMGWVRSFASGNVPLGLTVGLGSALAWGLGSIAIIDGVGRGANLLAAVLAAVSLGLLAPGPDYCGSQTVYVKSRHLEFAHNINVWACALGEHFYPPPTQSIECCRLTSFTLGDDLKP